MQTKLDRKYQESTVGKEADSILRKCVHCGFCNATCPTYQLLGDELDGPRGRIYLMKQVLEGAPVTRATQLHLDRCLTCRACETTCPSGVEFGRLLEIGRDIVEEKVERPMREKIERGALKGGLTSNLFAPAFKLLHPLRALAPKSIRDKIPTAQLTREWPIREHPRKMLLLAGCVQPTLLPNINVATARVLDAAGIQTLIASEADCCGSMHLHLADREEALNRMRRNVDAWWPYVEAARVETIVMNASGCGVTVKEYGRLLAHDARYAEKAKRIAALTRDVSELLPELVQNLQEKLKPSAKRQALHLPCTLQHGQKLPNSITSQLKALGFDVETAIAENHLCCGSAGAYSLLQPELAYELRDRKLKNLAPIRADVIVSANIGCIQHLQSGTETPVRHWIEVLEEHLVSTG